MLIWHKIFFSPFSVLLIVVQFETVCVDETENIEELTNIARDTLTAFFDMFWTCVSTVMPRQRFMMDNLQAFLFSPARTTVGLEHKYTRNRKFFANLINHKAYKTMIQEDEARLRRDFIRKALFCDNSVMDEKLLKDFYDREVDQSKLRK